VSDVDISIEEVARWAHLTLIVVEGQKKLSGKNKFYSILIKKFPVQRKSHFSNFWTSHETQGTEKYIPVTIH
jgi:hypothetical protein